MWSVGWQGTALPESRGRMQEEWGHVASETALVLHKHGDKGSGKCQEPKSRVLRFRPPGLAMCFQVGWDAAAGTKSRRGLGGDGRVPSFFWAMVYPEATMPYP